MKDVLAGVKQLFWNAEEERLRALFRIPAVIGLVLLALQLVFGAVSVFASFVGLPSPVEWSLILFLLTAAAVGIAWFVDRRYRRDMGLGFDSQWWLDVAAGLVVGMAMVATVVVVLRVAGMATLGGPHQTGGSAIAFGGGSASLGVLYGFVFFTAVAALEEFVIRGYLLTNIAEGVHAYVDSDRTAVWAAIVTTAGLFGLLHAANPGGTALGFLNIALAGIIFGVAYAATGRLAFPIGLHTTWNFALGPLFGLPVSGLSADTALVPVSVEGPALVTGGEFGPEGGLVMIAALAVGAGMLVWWLRSQYGTLAVDGRVAIPDLWSSDTDDG